MNPQEKQEFEAMRSQLTLLSEAMSVSANRITLHKTVIVDGGLNADRVYTQRTGDYVELTT